MITVSISAAFLYCSISFSIIEIHSLFNVFFFIHRGFPLGFITKMSTGSPNSFLCLLKSNGIDCSANSIIGKINGIL